MVVLLFRRMEGGGTSSVLDQTAYSRGSYGVPDRRAVLSAPLWVVPCRPSSVPLSTKLDSNGA